MRVLLLTGKMMSSEVLLQFATPISLCSLLLFVDVYSSPVFSSCIIFHFMNNYFTTFDIRSKSFLYINFQDFTMSLCKYYEIFILIFRFYFTFYYQKYENLFKRREVRKLKGFLEIGIFEKTPLRTL